MRRFAAACRDAALLLLCCFFTIAAAEPQPSPQTAALPAGNPGAVPADASPGQAQNLAVQEYAPPPAKPAFKTMSDAAQEPGQKGIDPKGRAAWIELEPGLSFGEFQLNENETRLSALRIDPARFDFLLCAASRDGRPARALHDWGEQYDLTAAINASMYLPDGSTSTGYMRHGEHVNNKRLVRRFGAFFVAGPDDARLPAAAILDRDDPLWRQRIDQYSLVIQNYRMINAERRILWSPGGPLYSISAVAQDGDGQILFLHCREPVEAYTFAQQLLHLPLNVRTVMYVEGGAQAGLLVRSASLRRELAGRSAADFLVTGNIKALLPNVLGVRRKQRPHAAAIAAEPPAAQQDAPEKRSGEPLGLNAPPMSPAAPALPSPADQP
ncbi:phosphodiester glycosidase family protein [Desulfovibrio sp. ZJ369]|uniref:phosphodiester glycosidase family protein n=1 Tax=Desulfovibrio sp. ZJ369 TaxID=2709793 RepID=UPI001F14EE65|nr:phosphodiester glycosidase family protein [Desulfovibrio sp. ZJ369]